MFVVWGHFKNHKRICPKQIKEDPTTHETPEKEESELKDENEDEELESFGDEELESFEDEFDMQPIN